MNATPVPGPTAPAAAAASPWRRRLVLGGLVIGAALLVERAVSLATEPAPAPAAEARPRVARPALLATARSGSDATAPDTAPVLHLDRLGIREQASSSGPDAPASQAAAQALFAAVNPPAPAAASAPVAAALPVAPPFPYSHIGGLLDETGRTLYFGRGNRLITVRTGDIIDSVYRVDQLSESALQLNYLPLNQPMTIRFGDPR